MANARTSLVALEKPGRMETVYETIILVVTIGAAGSMLAGVSGDTFFPASMDPGLARAIEVATWVLVLLVAGYFAYQVLLADGRFGLVYGVTRGDETYLMAPSGLAGFRKRQLLCGHAVTLAVRTGKVAEGSSATPSSRVRLESDGAQLYLHSIVSLGQPGAAEEAIRAWLASRGITLTVVEYPTT